MWINRNSSYIGLFGYTNRAKIENLGVEIAEAGIKGNNNVGGLVGGSNMPTIITNCYVKGKITGNMSVGGLVGNDGCSNTITNCYSTANVRGNDRVGGLVGYNIGRMTNCYATGKVTGTTVYCGGLVGYNVGSWAIITGCYFDTQTTEQINGVGGNVHGTVTVYPKTTSEMQQQSTYVGWDFTTLWDICEDKTYPFYKWQNILCDAVTVTVSANPQEGGTVTGGGEYNISSNVTVIATAKPGYTFQNWTKNSAIVNTNASYTFTASEDVSLVANFELSSTGGDLPVINGSLPDGKLGDIYGPEPLKVSGDEPIVWEITDGVLPRGLRLNQNSGEIRGKPTRAGTYTFTVKATNSAGSVSKVLSIWVEALCFE